METNRYIVKNRHPLRRVESRENLSWKQWQIAAPSG
jgi:hypothetical protein